MSQQEQLPALLDVDQVAYQLGLSARTVELRNLAGSLPGFVKVFNRHPRWKRDIILQWIQEGCPDFQKAQGGAIESTPIDELALMAVNSPEATDQHTNNQDHSR